MTTTIRIKDKAVNTTYQNVTGITGGSGDGAAFDVTKTDGVYSVVLDSLAASAGHGYAAGDTITLAGTALGGTAANNLIVTVATVGAAGKIATFGVVGTGRIGDGVIDVDVDVTGTAGVDTYTINGDSDDYTVSSDNGDITVASDLVSNFTFNLADHERVVFDDKAIAFDVTGDAGDIYALLGAALGVSDISEEYMGAGLYLKELGWSDKRIAEQLLKTDTYKLDAGGVSDETFVKHVWKNIFGTDATFAQVKEVTDVMAAGNYSQADILLVAANHATFQTTINLVGMASTGIDYIPYAG